MPKGDNTGGRRPGAGRAAMPQAQKRGTISMGVGKDTMRRMSMLREQGLQLNREFEAWIYQLSVSMGLEPDDDPTK